MYFNYTKLQDADWGQKMQITAREIAEAMFYQMNEEPIGEFKDLISAKLSTIDEKRRLSIEKVLEELKRKQKKQLDADIERELIKVNLGKFSDYFMSEEPTDGIQMFLNHKEAAVVASMMHMFISNYMKGIVIDANPPDSTHHKRDRGQYQNKLSKLGLTDSAVEELMQKYDLENTPFEKYMQGATSLIKKSLVDLDAGSDRALRIATKAVKVIKKHYTK